MATEKQRLGEFGETLVSKKCACPRCKRLRSLKRLPTNFKCADLVCDFCGYLAQVKSASVKDVNILPRTVMGAAWGPQKERMDASIYFPLFLVLKNTEFKKSSIFYLSADLQDPSLFIARKPLSADAKRAGWQGFYYDIASIHDHFVRLA